MIQTPPAPEKDEEEKDDPRLPPLPTSTVSNAIRHFLSSTSRFLNEFVAVADSRIEQVSKRIDAAESQLALLEAKLVPVPGLDDDCVKEEENVERNEKD